MAGRKPIPTHLKAVRGTLRESRVNHDEPQFDPSMPTPPEWLDAAALVEWGRLACTLHKMGLLSEEFRVAYALLCDAYSDYIRACQECREKGHFLESIQGAAYQAPWLGWKNKTRKDLVALLAEFGLTPASKSRVSAKSEKQEDANPFAKLAGK